MILPGSQHKFPCKDEEEEEEEKNGS